MHLNIHTITAENSSWIPNVQILVEGNIPLPEGAAPMRTVLDVNSSAEITQTRTEEGKLYLAGIAHFKILYIDTQGEFCGFDSETEFAHLMDTIDTEDVQILAWCHAAEVNYAPTDGHSLHIQCIVEASVLAGSNHAYQILDYHAQDPFLQLKTRDVAVPQLTCLHTGKTYLHTQLRVPQSLPAVKRVLSERGYAILRNITAEDGQAALEGEVKIFVVYESTDKNAPLQYFEETLPFGDILTDDALRESSKLYGMAVLESLATQPDADNTDILNISACIGLSLSARRSEQMCIVEDLYHEQQDVTLHTTQLSATLLQPHTCAKKVLRFSAELPDTAPDVSRVLFAGAHPHILNAVYKDAMLQLEGVLALNLCYTTAQNGIVSTQLQLPFETALSYTPEGAEPGFYIRAFGEYTLAEGSGRELELKTCLDLGISEVDQQSICVIHAASFAPAALPKEKGILIYYANGQESLWDVAKKFRVKQDVIQNIPETAYLPHGHKLILVSR